MKILVIVNSNDCLLRDSSGHASVAYNNTVKHLEYSRPKTTSSEAKRLTLPHTALNALKMIKVTLKRSTANKKHA